MSNDDKYVISYKLEGVETTHKFLNDMGMLIVDIISTRHGVYVIAGLYDMVPLYIGHTPEKLSMSSLRKLKRDFVGKKLNDPEHGYFALMRKLTMKPESEEETNA